MKKLNKISKTFLFLSLLSGALWMGSYLTRLVTSYQMFETKGFVLRNFINEQNISSVVTMLRAPVIATTILYFIFLVSFILFLVFSKLNLRKNGWLFIISLIIFITCPFELYLIATIDFDIINLLGSAGFSGQEVVNLVTERFKVLSSFPIIELLGYFSIIYFALFQPLKVKE